MTLSLTMAPNARTTSAQPTPGDPNISWPIERPKHPADHAYSQDSASDQEEEEEEWHPSFLTDVRTILDSSYTPDPRQTDPNNYPAGDKSLAGISLRAFLLGTSLGLTLSLTLLLTTTFPTPFWRVPFFVATLSLFHFLEYFVTARYNTREATVSAFLLSSNGWAYNAAHGSAVVECILSHWLFPGRTALGRMLSFTETVSGTSVSILLVTGFVLVTVGQVVRTLAMAQAASNFNHHVQVEHKTGHVLVKSGLYRFLRHPSYFGFFWWGLGTQLVLGNVVCFVGYAVVLWRFFYTRIKREFGVLCTGCGVLWLTMAGRRGKVLDPVFWDGVCPVQAGYPGWHSIHSLDASWT